MGAGILTARFLGSTGKGVALLAFFLPGFLSSLGSLSIGEGSTYYIGRGVAPRKVISNTIIQAFGLGLFYVALGLAFMEPIRNTVVKDVPAGYFVAGIIVLPLMLLKNYADGVLVALDRVGDFIAGNMLLHVSRALLILIALWPLNLGVWGAVAGEFVSWILTGGFYLRAMVRGHGFDWKIDWDLARDQFRYSAITHVGNMAQRMNHQTSTLILSSLKGAQAVGLFSVATSIAQILWYLPDAVGRILFPRVASSTRDEANRLTTLVCRHTLLITAACGLVVLLSGRWIVELLYGPEFKDSVGPLLWLLPGIVGSVVTRVLSKYLSGIGKPNYNAAASVISFGVNALLLFALVSAMGLNGAAIAMSVAYVFNGVISLILFMRVSKTRASESLVPTSADIKTYVDTARQFLARAMARP